MKPMPIEDEKKLLAMLEAEYLNLGDEIQTRRENIELHESQLKVKK